MSSGAAPQKYQHLMKIILVGDSGTGKSCLLHRFVEDSFSDEQTQTIGVEFGAKSVQVMGHWVKLQIWDTAGQERYRSVTRSYYRGAVGCLLVYDTTCRASFEHISEWLADVRQLAGKDVVVMLVGNKADLATGDRRAVTTNEAAALAQQRGILHYETSAASGELVNDAFMKVVKDAFSLMCPPSAQDDASHTNDAADAIDEDDEDGRLHVAGRHASPPPASRSRCSC